MVIEAVKNGNAKCSKSPMKKCQNPMGIPLYGTLAEHDDCTITEKFMNEIQKSKK